MRIDRATGGEATYSGLMWWAEEGGEFGRREGRGMRTIEGVRVEVKDRFPGGGYGSGEDRLGEASADDDEVERRWIDRRVRREVGHGRAAAWLRGALPQDR